MPSATMRRSRNTIISLSSIAIMLIGASSIQAHDISPGAPDWCKEEKVAVAETHPEGYKPKPGDWPGPSDTVGAEPREEHGATSLGTEFPGFTGRNMRARFGALKPGGWFNSHCHDDRPTMILVLAGKATETVWIDGRPVIKHYKAGDLIAEGRGIRHWWLNPSASETLAMVTVDLANVPHRPPPPHATDGGDWTVGTWFNLANEFPHIGGLRGIEALTGILILQPGEKTAVINHKGRPRFAFVIEGTVTEHRSDSQNPVIHEKYGSSHASGATWSYWVNTGTKRAKIFVYRFSDCDGDCRPTGAATKK